MGEEKSRDIAGITVRYSDGSTKEIQSGCCVDLKSRNDAIISPYKTYELFFEITFMVIQKLGAYEEIGTPEECLEAMQTARACQAQCLDNINDPLEPLKISSALKSELLKLQFRKAEKPESISPLDYTVIAALKEALEKRVQSNDR